MPYRRLPTTDAARLRALYSAFQVADQQSISHLAYSHGYIHTLRNIHQQLESVKAQQVAAQKQVHRISRDNQANAYKTRLYLSHFIKVFNMSISREEIHPKERQFFGMRNDEANLPDLKTDTSLYDWGKRIIEGENKRLASGKNPILNPTIGKVKVWYDQFKDGYLSEITARKSFNRANAQLKDLRSKADALIQAVWNEVESHCEHLPEPERRAAAQEYGVVYVFRKDEQET